MMNLLLMACAGQNLIPPVTMIVAGATNSPVVNGTYTENGTYDGKPVYFLNGGTADDKIEWFSLGSIWTIFSGLDSYYYSTDDVATPDLVTTWLVDVGLAPVPTVTLG